MKRFVSGVAVSGAVFAFLWVIRAFRIVEDALILSLIGAALFFFGAVVLKILMPRTTVPRFFSVKPMSFLDWRVALTLTVILVSGSFLLNFITQLFYDALGVSAPAAFSGGGYSSMGLALICISVLPALFEEIFFRGALLTTFRCAKLRSSVVIAVTSIIFMILHGPGWYFVSDLYAGVVLSLAVYFTGSLYSSVAIHFLANTASYFLAHYGGKLSDAGIGNFMAHIMAVAFLGGICHLLKLIRKLILRGEAEDRSRVNENARRWEAQQRQKKEEEK